MGSNGAKKPAKTAAAAGDDGRPMAALYVPRDVLTQIKVIAAETGEPLHAVFARLAGGAVAAEYRRVKAALDKRFQAQEG